MPRMEPLKTLFFENPFYVYVTLGVAELVLTAIWWERRTPRWRQVLLIPPVLAGLVLLVERLVVTDREQLLADVREIARGLEMHQSETLDRYLDDDFRGYLGGREIDRKAAIETADQAVKGMGVSSVSLRDVEVQVNGATARMRGEAWLTFQAPNIGVGRGRLEWEVVWRKRGGQWRIAELVRIERK
jgi:hypothetical protein